MFYLGVREMSEDKKEAKSIIPLQLVLLLLMWSFAIGFSIMIVRILLISMDLKDAAGFSVVVSLIAVPVLLLLASILTYVFVGLHKNRPEV